MSLALNRKKLLLITSSGGGGLLQTANAKAQEALAKDPTLTIIRKDVLKDWAPFSSFSIQFWNRAQRGGNVFAQMLCVKGQFIWDFFFHFPIFFQTLATLLKEDVDAVIDTQPMGTSAIVKALKVFNRKRGKQLRVEKVLVDLPTKEATHFFRSIKKLDRKDRALLKLTTIAPLLEEGETAEEFWQKTCGLSDAEINYEEVYVRHAFRQYKSKKREPVAMDLLASYKTEDEWRQMERVLNRGSIPFMKKENEVTLHIEPQDRVITILLGSQPAEKATLEYVTKWAEVAKRYPEVKTHLFIFCGAHGLFDKVVHLVDAMREYPQSLSVIPLSFQSEHAIAPIFYRSDATCTRSGGQTAMELMCVATGAMWIHSEAKKGEDLLKGIPGWEAASAVYLQKLHGAHIVTPDTFIPYAEDLYRKGS